MRLSIPFILVAVLSGLSPVFGAGPSTQPDVLVVPFKPLVEPTTQPALGRAVQQNLLADLARARFHPAQQNELFADPAAAGKRAGVRFVISGTWQSSDELVRFDGQILDLQSGLIVGGLNATGPMRELFTLEDKLSSQAVGQLKNLTAPPAPQVPAGAPAAIEYLPPATPPEPIYRGSDLEAYVNSYRTPSNDYWTQYHTSHDREVYGFNEAGYSPFYGFGYGYGIGYGGGYYGGGFSYGYGLNGPASFPGRHLPFR